ncbi:MAG: hypothetical protein KGO96_04295 [Elusimicrobia bacterium]|nr:hypothetical protein [Elusimicrobiota bacterium]MDE2236945.1 hypothetical protein [Elusimicrobiota bacterium]MDE2425113.1 hypothetical protein [Elusimicrobiota bacterium]
MNPLLAAVLWPILTGAGLAVAALPRAWELRLGALLGRLALSVDSKRRRIAGDNIRRCLPELDAAGRNALLRANYEHYGRLCLELLHMFCPLPGHYRRYVEANAVVDNLDVWSRADAKGKGTIIVTGHFANWEMMGIAGLRGLRAMVTGRRLKPAWLNARIVAARLSVNTRTASGRRILPELIRWVKEGNSSVFILDQYAAPPAGVPVRFFGVLADTQAAVGLVAQRTGAPVLMLFQRRDRVGTIHDVFEDVPLGEAQLKDPAAAAQELAARVERWIRAQPDQWLWAHRRFKNVVWPDDDSDRKT